MCIYYSNSPTTCQVFAKEEQEFLSPWGGGGLESLALWFEFIVTPSSLQAHPGLPSPQCRPVPMDPQTPALPLGVL